MEQIDNLILGSLEKATRALGLYDGLPRAIVLGVAGSAVIYYFKPTLMVDEATGKLRPWNVTSPDAKEPASTPLPLWLAGVGIATLTVYFL